MTTTPQWAIDAVLECLSVSADHETDHWPHVIAYHASTDPVRELAGRLVEIIEQANRTNYPYDLALRSVADELKKALED